MARREFAALSVAGVRLYRIECAECGAIDDWRINGSRPPLAAIQSWKAAGWRVGNRPKFDCCPDCLAASKQRPGAPSDMVKDISPMANAADCAPKADQPRSMTREDRRIIFEKLNDVYLDEARGYAPGNSDKSVAESLGCPRAWVAQIRDENFGAARDNEDVRDLLAKIDALREIVVAASSEFEALKARLTEVNREMVTLSRAAAAIEKATV